MAMPLIKDRRAFEIMLIIVTVGMACLYYMMGAQKVLVLNLFFLPIVLSGYYLGRTSAGVLALFAVLAVMIISGLDAPGMANINTPLMMGLTLAFWGSVLGLTAILVGTLCDVRTVVVRELHEAYVGVVEVLARYLQDGGATAKAQAGRVADLSRRVAEHIGLESRQVDDIRVAGLLCNLGSVEVTTRVVRRAIDALGAGSGERHTFKGEDMLCSLEPVLGGAAPLIIDAQQADHHRMGGDFIDSDGQRPIGTRILHAVKAYDALVTQCHGEPTRSASEALLEMRQDSLSGYDPVVLDAIETVVQRENRSQKRDMPLAQAAT